MVSSLYVFHLCVLIILIVYLSGRRNLRGPPLPNSSTETKTDLTLPIINISQRDLHLHEDIRFKWLKAPFQILWHWPFLVFLGLRYLRKNRRWLCQNWISLWWWRSFWMLGWMSSVLVSMLELGRGGSLKVLLPDKYTMRMRRTQGI